MQIEIPSAFHSFARKEVHLGVGGGEEMNRQAQHAPGTFFLGVDIDKVPGIEYGTTMRNLSVLRGVGATAVARELPSGSVHKFKSILLFSWLATAQRAALSKAMRGALAPGGQVEIVETAPLEMLLAKELKEAGFEVSSRRLSARELIEAHPSLHAIKNAAVLERLRSQILARTGASSIADRSSNAQLRQLVRDFAAQFYHEPRLIEAGVPYEQATEMGAERVSRVAQQGRPVRLGGAALGGPLQDLVGRPQAAGITLESLAKLRQARGVSVSSHSSTSGRGAKKRQVSAQARAAFAMVDRDAWKALSEEPFVVVTGTKRS